MISAKQLRLYTPLALLFSLLWASAFIAVKFALLSSPPLFMMGSRFLVAGAVLLGFAALRRHEFPKGGREWSRMAILGLLNHALYLGISAVALLTLTGSSGAILASTNPLMVAVTAAVVLRERQTLLQNAGMMLAFISVVVTMGARAGIGDPLDAMGLILLANACMVAGTVLFKRWKPIGSLAAINGIQLLSASIALLVVSFAVEEPLSHLTLDANLFLSVGYLIVAISWCAVLIWFYLLRSGNAGKASAFLFLNPVFGLFLGAAILGDPLRPIDFVGAVGVAIGIYLVQRTRSEPA